MSALAETIPAVGWPLKTEPWSHQREAFDLARQHSAFIFAHGMGAGKSATALATMEADEPKLLLVLCPKSVVDVWPDQIKQHCARTWRVWAGSAKATASTAEKAVEIIQATVDALRLGQPLAVVVNYEAIWRDEMKELLLGTQWDGFILDESHRIKMPGGKTSLIASQISGRVRARGGRVLALTGTPMPHSPLDLWAQMRAIDGGRRLGHNYRLFCAAFAKPEQVHLPGNKVQTIYKGLLDEKVSEFSALVAPVLHRVETTDVVDLPATTDAYRTCRLSKKGQAFYDALEKDLIAEVDGHVITAANAMVLTLRLAQAANGFGRDADTEKLVDLDGPPAKAQLLADVLEDIPEREPVVVFCRFHADLDAVAAVCEKQGRRYGELSGRRRDALDGPRMSNDIDVAGVQLQSGGVGIDLTRSRHAIYYSLDFRLADHEQSRARIHRPGQTRPVLYTYLLTEGTIDRAICGALRSRQEVVDALIAYLKQARS